MKQISVLFDAKKQKAAAIMNADYFDETYAHDWKNDLEGYGGWELEVIGFDSADEIPKEWLCNQ